MAGMPWLPWFHRDFIAATQGWTLLERGAYFMLLCASWEMGPLPNDQRRLASIIGAQLDDLESVWPVVGSKFDETERGLVNRRLEEHRAAQAEKCEKARESARKRWNRSANGHANASANGYASASPKHMRTDMHPDPDPEPEPDPKTDPESGSGVLEDSDSRPLPLPRTRERPTYDGKEFHEQVIAAYHELLPELPAVKVWSMKRRQALNARIRERCKDGKPADTVEYWRKLFESVAASDFLCGRVAPNPGRESWRPDLEWLLRPENFAKVIEGRYSNARRTNGGVYAS